MAEYPNPNDPLSTTGMSRSEEMRRNDRLEREMQADPELVEGQSSAGRVAAYALGILLLLGAVFYGLNAANNSHQTASNPPANVAQSSPTNAPPPGPPVRNVTPGPNTTPGTTTGSAPSPTPAPASPSK